MSERILCAVVDLIQNMELPLSQEAGIGAAGNNKNCAQILKVGERRKPQSKYRDEECFRIAQYAKEHGASRAATFFKSKYKIINESTV